MKNEEKDFGSLAATEDAAAFANPAPDAASHAAKDDGGFAFPVLEEYTKFNEHTWQYEDYYAPHGGMKLRDYFAAHAPKRPQAWFHPTMPPRPAAVHGCSHGPEHTERCCREFCSPDNWKEIDQWDANERTERLKQWPYAYADAQLKERAK